MMIDSRFKCFNSLLNLSRIISPHSKNSSPKFFFFKKNIKHVICSNKNKSIRINKRLSLF
ncbi:hypothetical protein GIB67_025342, partial [Kingdonia uniflora]